MRPAHERIKDLQSELNRVTDRLLERDKRVAELTIENKRLAATADLLARHDKALKGRKW